MNSAPLRRASQCASKSPSPLRRRPSTATLDVAALSPELPPDAVEEAATEPQAPALPGRERQTQERQEFARVDADLLDTLLNNAGEVSIFRSRLEQQVGSIEFNLAELGRTVTRLKDQLRKLEMETEAQILHRHEEEHPGREDFDPLELDRYSTIQQLSRAFAESVSDVGSIEGLLENLTREAQNLLLQQSRVVTELQNGLMRTRMVPFQRHVQRLSRLVRQVASETDKRAELVVVGASGELDRQVLERMLPPFEHMLRNSVVHGIETPQERVTSGKPESGTIRVGLHREGSEMVIVLEDDGRGIDVNAVRERARARGLLQPGRVLSDEEAMQLILEPGFSTANTVTQHAGRGVGMDVVVNEIKKLGGALFTESQPGKGVKFTIRLPFTLAITQALIVRTGDELYALPLPSVEGVARVPRSEVQKHLAEEAPTFSYGGQIYRFQHLGAFIGGGPSVLPEVDVSVPVILIRAGEHSTAVVTDELVGSREMVVKSVGPQIATIRGIAGATILGDGRIVIILDMGALVRSEWRGRSQLGAEGPKQDKRTFALVVDDSITVRRVTQRLLERHGMRVMTAKDGVDALSILQDHLPDVILLDIEMPRMDGYELASHVRSDARTGGYSNRHDHIARRREASRPRNRTRRQRLSRQALPGKSAARCDRAAGRGAPEESVLMTWPTGQPVDGRLARKNRSSCHLAILPVDQSAGQPVKPLPCPTSPPTSFTAFLSRSRMSGSSCRARASPKSSPGRRRRRWKARLPGISARSTGAVAPCPSSPSRPCADRRLRRPGRERASSYSLR